MASWRRTAQPAPAFPRARLVVPRGDWEAWSRPEVQDAFPVPYVGDTIAPLIESGDVDLIEGEHSVSARLPAADARAHPGELEPADRLGGGARDAGRRLWLHPSQVTDPALACSFDMEPDTARKTRAALAKRIADEGMIMGACHFPEPFGQLVRLEGRHHWMPVARWRDGAG